ncbi:MAG: preprotein translocase subunit SecA [Pseudomonadota bacterium]|nr:preprotein translocase subunit SecA [Pseudomonadota bacterium]MEC7955579.1 preprotein translocase subunit SecA [Pseudomonadota bacterium]MEC7969129.1 preprotein translocase subunit SecA [Pseudomonadota bacterium]MEC7975836.1 preprotein translocase subunit SecA [Pseudomonadota bacterium]
MANFFTRIFGSKNSRELRRMQKIVERINTLEATLDGDTDLLEWTENLRERAGKGESLDALLPEAFAAVREAAKRTKGMRHYDVQLIGGITLHEGRIAEMRTGEGKTLMATLPAYLNALSGNGVHVVTVNDYLAKRDADWMAPIYEALGMRVGVIQSNQPNDEKHSAYGADITYGTNNEFGFDYLRSNMAFTLEDRLQRGLNFAIIDEVDSILIDEARTPLIISGAAEESTKLYQILNQVAPTLKEQPFDDTPRVFGEPEVEPTGDFSVDEKNRQIEITELGHQKIEQALVQMGLLEEGDSLYSSTNLNLLHHVLAALKAHALFKRDVDYMVRNQEVVIVDEHTGRAMPGRRWSDGIHQAIEAKEGLPIQNESQTLASTTFQNYFRLYEKLSGMTGTADTEAFEFNQIYGLDVVVIPTHKPMVRDDQNDLIYLTLQEKYDAIVEDIETRTKAGQPILVGTASIESSELLSTELTRRGISHNVLNAKQHQREADIVADAGRPSAVTIATNMAGRGTDIVLGGNLEAELERAGAKGENNVVSINEAWEKRHADVLAAGGLHIIGTERHESRRIDNQLRGRAGRQGDPGSSRFYLSVDDNLMRIFVNDNMRGMMQKLGGEPGEAIEHKLINRSIENAQRKVEGHNFDIRKNLLEYDDVSNDQRQVIYQQRLQLMQSESIADTIEGLREEVIVDLVGQHIPPDSLAEQWDLVGLQEELQSEFGSHQPLQQWLEDDDSLDESGLIERILQQAESEYATKQAAFEAANIDLRLVEKQVMLQLLDQRWKEHLASMDQLRQGIHLRAYAQKQPKQEFKRESFELFQSLLYNIKYDVVRTLSRMQLENPEELAAAERKRRAEAEQHMQFQHASAGQLEAPEGEGQSDSETQAKAKPAPFVRDNRKVGRNEPCPCGSGKKFKQCCGRAGAGGG